MQKREHYIVLLIVILVLSAISCKKEEKKTSVEKPPLVGTEVDVEKIQDTLGIQCQILKTDTVGYSPTHKFLWVCIETDLAREKVLDLAHALIEQIISRKPQTYHSFTLHFFRKKDLAQTVTQSEPFARAEYLPEGGWLKVGRTPIENYQNYKLTCSFFEE